MNLPDINPETFDYKTERVVKIKRWDDTYTLVEDYEPDATDGRGGIRPIDMFRSVHSTESDVREERLWEYEIDIEGNVVIDSQTGLPKIKTQVNKQGLPVPLTWKLSAPRAGSADFHLPRDAWRLKQVFRMPYFVNIPIVDGKRTTGFHKYLWVDDPELLRIQRQNAKRKAKEAKEYAAAIPDEQLKGYVALLDLYVEEDADQDDLRFAVEEEARDNPASFLDKTRDNLNLKEHILYKLALREGVLVDRGPASGIFYVEEGKKDLHLGMEQGEVLVSLKQYPTQHRKLIARIGYAPFVETQQPVEEHQEETAQVQSRPGRKPTKEAV